MGTRGRRSSQVRSALRELIAAEMAHELGQDGTPATAEGTQAQRVEQARRRYDTARSTARQEAEK